MSIFPIYGCFPLDLWLKEGFTEHEAYKWYYRNYTLEEALVWKKTWI
ncbi:MAG: hypothetical protein ACTSR8_07240 [Promethearchaeota archaeon]